VTPAIVETSGSSSGTETGDTEIEATAAWDVKHTNCESDDVFSLGGYTDLSEFDFVIEKTTEERWEAMSKKDNSNDSGRGETPTPGFAELMALMVQDGKRRNEEKGSGS